MAVPSVFRFEPPPVGVGPAEMLATIERLRRPPEADVPPPAWLRPEQRLPFRRLVAALEAWSTALLASPVGAGKTWVSLGAASRFRGGRPVEVIGPAVLRAQWLRTAEAAGVPIRFTSHEAVSRGAFAFGDGSAPVIVDESHRFRNPAAARHRLLKPGLNGRPVILVSATPVVNRAEDLLAQFSLRLGDDALLPGGYPSLAGAVLRGEAAALDRLVITAPVPTDIPAVRSREVRWARAPDPAELVTAITALRLSRDPATAGLIRSSLLWAAASSPAALGASLDRYCRLLRHGGAARRGGHRPNRAAIRRITGAMADQLLFWELLPAEVDPADLALGDLRPALALRRRARRLAAGSDAKFAALADLVADRRPTLVFAGPLATVHYLRRRLGTGGVCWLTGSTAGWNGARVGRAAVLRAFGPERGDPGVPTPWLLLASDVAAEGLDLQRVERVVHYDLPWTAVRLAQRTGRAVRLGSVNAAVEVVRFEPPTAIEAEIRLVELLQRKAGLPHRLGLGRREGAAGVVGAKAPDAVAGIVISQGDAPAADQRAVRLVVVRRGDDWCEARTTVDAVLARWHRTTLPDLATEPDTAETFHSLQRWLERRLASLLGHWLTRAQAGSGSIRVRVVGLLDPGAPR
ncbi:MAG: DEAD/DEAH box helicase [Gemmatimonadales bacterium]